MNDKKTFYSLDDIGFIGTAKKRTAIQQKKDAVKTGEIIRREKSATRKKSAIRLRTTMR